MRRLNVVVVVTNVPKNLSLMDSSGPSRAVFNAARSLFQLYLQKAHIVNSEEASALSPSTSSTTDCLGLALVYD
ncbi:MULTISPECIES: hypothetical protein [unclassified Devosia]|uniref:hypothetical protein n=1 Tax=unclassified Devosia TaxID=196773 RepID=UPI00145D6B2F|nr:MULTISPECIES: hypothetical protein [unclassified Devosia]MBJ6987755.1 hypothetical protein [Devosia sp. MC521]QMW62428.1 hypothetical protein H4N61_16150 [Devosia sp. MC521]